MIKWRFFCIVWPQKWKRDQNHDYGSSDLSWYINLSRMSFQKLLSLVLKYVWLYFLKTFSGVFIDFVIRIAVHRKWILWKIKYNQFEDISSLALFLHNILILVFSKSFRRFRCSDNVIFHLVICHYWNQEAVFNIQIYFVGMWKCWKCNWANMWKYFLL